jgi:hypothetical protein
VTVVTDAFVDLGREVAGALGTPQIRSVVIPHPLGGLDAKAVAERSRRALHDIVQKLTAQHVDAAKVAYENTPRTLDLSGSSEEINEYFYARRWTDGLPIVPPTVLRVERMLASATHPPDTLLGFLPPTMGAATIEKIAVNAVMAGCDAQCFPVVVAAVQAICTPEFNLLPMQATTNPVTPMIIVNGPVAKQLDINCGHNVLGQGWKSNATIGRALRLVLTNIGGGVPGTLDKATHGQPGKFTLCIAENEHESPWEPFHVERGYESHDSTVSVIGVTGTQDVIHYARTSAEKVLSTLMHAIPREGFKNLYSGGEPLIIFGPEQAAILGSAGLTKQDVKRIVFERARVPLSLLNPETVTLMRGRRHEWLSSQHEIDAVPIADRPDDVQIVVAGGTGNHTVFVPTWGDTRCVTVKL